MSSKSNQIFINVKKYEELTISNYRTLTTLMTSSSQSSLVKFFFSLFFFKIREGEGIRMLKRFGTEGRNGNILLCLLPPSPNCEIKLMIREIVSVINE